MYHEICLRTVPTIMSGNMILFLRCKWYHIAVSIDTIYDVIHCM